MPVVVTTEVCLQHIVDNTVRGVFNQIHQRSYCIPQHVFGSALDRVDEWAELRRAVDQLLQAIVLSLKLL